jgi:hypothetical protein
VFGSDFSRLKGMQFWIVPVSRANRISAATKPL